MSKVQGIAEWLEGSGLVEDMHVDIDHLGLQGKASIYQQTSADRAKFIDGTELVTETYYVLFKRSALVRTERISNNDYLEKVENWILEQEQMKHYPDIGYEVHEVDSTNAFYMTEQTRNDAIYQLTLSIKYIR